MCNHNKNIFTHMLILSLFLFTVVGYTSVVQTGPKPIKPDYENVDVFVECDWGENENMVQSTVYDNTKAENPHLLIFR